MPNSSLFLFEPVSFFLKPHPFLRWRGTIFHIRDYAPAILLNVQRIAERPIFVLNFVHQSQLAI